MSFREMCWNSPDKSFKEIIPTLWANWNKWRAFYRNYLELVRVLQEKGVPVKPVSPELFKKKITREASLGVTINDHSGISKKMVKKDLRKALFAGLAASMVAGNFGDQLNGLYFIREKHAMDYKNVDIPPEHFARVMGEINKRAIRDAYREMLFTPSTPPPEVEHVPEWTEEAAKVLEEFFEGDHYKMKDFILSVKEEPSEEELKKMYSELALKASDLLKEWKEKRVRIKELKPPKR